MAELSDPNQSRIVLIGSAEYEQLPAIPAVRNNVSALAGVFTDPVLWGLSPENAAIIVNEANPVEAARSLRAAAGSTGPDGLLLIYFAGHGLVDQDGSLVLGLAGVDRDNLSLTGLPYDLIRRAVMSSPAQRRVVILDCCFAGRADMFMSVPPGEPGIVADLSIIDHTVLLAATSATTFAIAAGDTPYTAFTGELLTILQSGIPGEGPLLTMQAIFRALNQATRDKKLPLPQLRAQSNAENLPLVRNRAAQSADATQPDAPGGPAPAPVLAIENVPPNGRTIAGIDADSPAGEDRLEFGTDVNTLCDVIMASNIQPPLAIGLFGDWGTGKSFFMGMMRQRIAWLASTSSQFRSEGLRTAYCATVCQIDFNAWHYVDANLWASLTGTILDRLAEDLDHGAALQDLPSIHAQRRYLQIRRAEAQCRLAAANEDLARQDPIGLGDVLTSDQVTGPAQTRLTRALKQAGVPDKGLDLREAAADLSSTFGRFLFLLRRGTWPTRLLLIGLVVLAVVGSAGALVLIDGTLRAFAVAVAPALVALVTLRARVDQAKPVLNIADDIVRRVDAQRAEPAAIQRDSLARLIAHYEEEMHHADALIQTLEGETSVRSFAADRGGTDDYRRHEGLVATVRRDLQELSRRLVDSADVERIVLYIDDLDRCPPARVVEVLQAVNLLLAFPLFVVVVGVDARWLIRSIRVQYDAVLGASEGGEDDHWASTPQNYLEKIFQLSINLRPLSRRAYDRLICDGLLRDIEPDPMVEPAPLEPTPGDTPTPGPASTDDPAPPPPAADAASPTQARQIQQYPIASAAIALGFGHSGRWLTAVLQNGSVVQWDTRDPQNPGREVTRGPGEVTAAAVAPSGHALLVGGSRVTLVCDGMPARSVETTADGTESTAATVALDGSFAIVGGGSTLTGLRFGSGGDGPVEEFVLRDSGTPVLLTPHWHLVHRGTDALLIRPPDNGSAHLPTRPPAVLAAADPQGSTLVTVDTQGRLTVAPVTLEPQLRVGATSGEAGDHMRDAVAVAVSGTGLIAAITRRRQLLVWSSTENRLVIRNPAPTEARLLAFSPDGRRLAISCDSADSEPSISIFALAPSAGADLTASTLLLTVPERRSLMNVEPLIATPRSAKRLVNTYRLLRAGLTPEDGARLRTGAHQIVALLLALLVGHPEKAAELLGALADPATTGLLTEHLGAQTRVVRAVRDVLADLELADDLALYRDWAPYVARFSFRTGHIPPPSALGTETGELA
jgi:hypothetical protein